MRLQSLPATGQPTRVTTMQGQNLFVRDEPDRRRRVWAATPVSPNRARAASAAVLDAFQRRHQVLPFANLPEDRDDDE